MDTLFLKANLTVKQRLIALCTGICLISAIPLCAYFLSMKANWDFNAAEQRGIPPTQALVQLMGEVQGHRSLSATALQNEGQGGAQSHALAQAMARHWQAFEAQWAETGLSVDVATQSARLRAQFEALQGDVDRGKLSPDDSFRRHGELMDALLALLFDMNGSDNMLFDPEDTTYLLIIAGFQEGPRVTELARRMRDLGVQHLRGHPLSPTELQEAMATQGRLQDRMSTLALHVKSAASRMPELQDRLALPTLARLSALKELADDTQAMLLGAPRGQAYTAQADTYEAHASELIDAQAAMSRQLTEAVQKALAARQASIWQQVQVQIALVIALGTAGMALVLGVIRRIVSALSQMERLAVGLGQGDLTQRCASTRRDEIGDCMNALESARMTWERIAHNLVDAVNTVSGAAAQIASSSQDLNARTRTAANSLVDTTQSIRGLTQTVQQTADSAREADLLARSAKDTAEQGEQVMGEVVNNMNDISASSRRIADIVGVIDSIAFQTNILALNAAVEAARAGESGRGFAVVASEVRALAKRSANSAQEIKTLIGDSLSKVDAGAALVRQAGHSMQAIMGSNHQVTQLISEISAATRHQSEGFGQVNEGIGRLDGMTAHNVAMVQQSSSAAEHLHDQAEMLTQLVAIFQLDTPHPGAQSADENPSPPAAPR